MMTTRDPTGWFSKLLRALRVKTRLEFFALVVFFAWVVCLIGLYRGGADGLVAFIAGFLLVAVITLLVARSTDV